MPISALFALLQLRIEPGDVRFAVLAVVLGLLLVAADDIAIALDLHLLDEELRFSRLALDQEGHERIVVFEHDFAHEGVGALARAQDVFQLALFQPGDGGGRDHPAVGDDADPAAEAKFLRLGSLAAVIFRRDKTLAVGIEERFLRVETETIGGIERPINSIGVELGGGYPRNKDVPVVGGAIRDGIEV